MKKENEVRRIIREIEHEKHIVKFGVFTRDVYEIPKNEQRKFLVKTFDDYGKALKFANKLGEKSAIHFVNIKIEVKKIQNKLMIMSRRRRRKFDRWRDLE